MLDTLSQITITLFGGTALWLMNCRNERRRRWGVICGLCSQPAWYVQMVLHAQWLMLPVYCAYTGAWLFGLWNYWLKTRKCDLCGGTGIVVYPACPPARKNPRTANCPNGCKRRESVSGWEAVSE